MEKIKIGQIGIGHNHGEQKMMAVQKYPELFEVVGYAEENEDWIEKRGNLQCYRNLPRLTVEEVIEKSEAILVECDVWNLTKIAKKCIDAGKHVHIDKPASGTLSEFEELLNSAEKQNLVVQMGYMYRYNFALNKCMDMINSGELGEIYQIDAEMSTYHSSEYREWLKNFKGGSMYIFGCHLIDLVIKILGEPKAVHSFIKQTGYDDVYSDDNCFAVLEYDKAIARITNLSVEVNGWKMRRFAVMGSKGTVELKPIEVNAVMTKSTKDGESENVEIKDITATTRYDEMIQDFYKSIKGEIENPYSYEHEYMLQKTLCKIVGEN